MSATEMMERARKRLRSSTASGGQRLSLVACYSKIGVSPETPVVISGEGFHPIASMSPPKPFKASALSLDKFPANSAKKFPAELTSAVDNINISLPPNFLGDGDAPVVWLYDDRLMLPSTYRRYREETPMATASGAAELSLRVSLLCVIFP